MEGLELQISNFCFHLHVPLLSDFSFNKVVALPYKLLLILEDLDAHKMAFNFVDKVFLLNESVLVKVAAKKRFR